MKNLAPLAYFLAALRKLTEAVRRAGEVSATIAAGTIRRAFVKGWGQAAGCQAPATPMLAPLEAPVVKPVPAPL